VEARVIDLDGVYDPCRPNDRLLLGMKGSISEFELGIIRSRMYEAANVTRRSKIVGGAYRTVTVIMPVGSEMWPGNTPLPRAALRCARSGANLAELCAPRSRPISSAGSPTRFSMIYGNCRTGRLMLNAVYPVVLFDALRVKICEFEHKARRYHARLFGACSERPTMARTGAANEMSWQRSSRKSTS
jgi:hypothetical protein